MPVLKVFRFEEAEPGGRADDVGQQGDDSQQLILRLAQLNQVADVIQGLKEDRRLGRFN